ncbi:MAG: DUF4157 domain-containing protein [Bacteroidales bacterium]|nr:DUF4157 domain-containing protein [Bacteroidales bacterium]
MKQQQKTQKVAKNQETGTARLGNKRLNDRNLQHPFLQAQNIIGNHGLLNCCSGVIQTKLKVGQPNDKYEQEADRVAEQVMRVSDVDVAQQVENGTVRPMQIQRMCVGCKEEEMIQAKGSPGQTPQVTSNIESRINTLKGGGQPLAPSEKSFFENGMGYDFSGVRIHKNNKATDAASSINARAFTVGNDIVFNRGDYNPETFEGKRLLGHELIHTIQQQKTPEIIQREPLQGIPEGGVEVGKIGIVNWNGDPKLRLRSSPDTESNNIGSLAFNTTVYVAKSFSGDWYYITTENGEMGYVAKTYIWTHLPEPNSKLHKVESGVKGTAIAIAEKYYGDKADDWGQDLRFYVNVLAIMNKQSVPDRTDGWKDVRFEADSLIWIPSQPFAYGMKSLVNSGSISYEALDAIGMAEFIEGMVQKLGDIESAIKSSMAYMGDAIQRHVEEALVNMLVSLALILVAAVAILAVSTAIGAGLGALAGGASAVPGAAAGFEVGLVILKWLGLAMIIAWVGQALWETGSAFATFFGTVWNANGDKDKIDQAAWEFADAVGILIGNLLEALVMYAASVGLVKGVNILRNSKMGKSMGETKSGEWLTERVRKVTSGEAALGRPIDVYNRITRGVEFVDGRGITLGEFDGVDMRNSMFIEHKSASGLSRVNPRTGRPQQTPQQWAQNQITKKTRIRINNLARVSSTRAANGADYSVPGLAKIQGFRHIYFKLDGNTPALRAAVFAELAVLKAEFPGWKFTADFGFGIVLPPVPDSGSTDTEREE